ncbi:MAG TPA: alpha/beta fold hydrolase [Acidimicrobiales bacterium]|nr:alpha/beta fold hydrolase [Acidimicrobiales bacterium]
MPLHADAHGDPAASKVVLVHGFTQTRRSWAPLVPRLARHHRVLAVDAPAHGRSADHRTDLAEGANLLGETGGCAAYIGYSMGGRLALHLALQRPELVERVVLVGATGGLDTEEERSQRRAADEVLAIELERDGLDAFLERWLANPLFATLPKDPAALEDRRENTVEGLADSLRRTGTGTQEPLWGHLPQLSMPALLVVGERDEKFTVLANRLADGWGGPARVAVIADAGHACHVEQPEAFLDLVMPFLDEGQRTASPAANSNP